MKQLLRFLSGSFLVVLSTHLAAQIISTEPELPTAGQAVTITFDATQGTAGLKDYTGDVYAHTGVLTNLSSNSNDWRYVKTDWGENTPETKMTRESANQYSLADRPFHQGILRGSCRRDHYPHGFCIPEFRFQQRGKG
jgi:hypothetical protein